MSFVADYKQTLQTQLSNIPKEHKAVSKELLDFLTKTEWEVIAVADMVRKINTTARPEKKSTLT